MALINGTALDDVLVSLAGADTLTALGGNDVILVAAPLDHPAGEKIDGGAGYDRLWFTSTNPADLLTLRATDLGIESVQIADAVGNSSGLAAVHVDASAYATALQLAGNDGANALTGTKFNDTIIGNGGADTIVGGLGADRIVMGVAAADVDKIDAGALTELNTLVLVGAAPQTAIIDLNAVDQLVSFGPTADALVQSGFANVDASGMTGFGVQITGSALKNILIGSAQNDVFLFSSQATLGSDVVSGGGGYDVLWFTSGSAGQTLALTAGVTVESAEIADLAGLTTGVVALNLNAAAVTAGINLTGNDGANLLTGSAFNDTLNGNGGADTLLGGSGNDVYNVDSAADWVLLDQIIDTKGTDDRIVFSDTNPGTLVLSKVTGVEAVYLSNLAFSTSGNTALNVDGSALLTGMAYVGNVGANSLAGGKGNDTFTGNGGVDTIGGADTIVGGLGADVVVFDVANDSASVDAGAAAEGNKLKLVGTVTGTLSVDLRQGVDIGAGTLQDQYLSDIGGNTQGGFAHVDASGLNGAVGGVAVTLSSLANTVIGSSLDDQVIVYAPSHLSSVDSINGGDGNDTLRFASTTAGQTLVVGAKVVHFEGAEISDAAGITTGTTALNINAAAAVNGLTLTGNDGANTLIGTKFNDTLIGNLGLDTLQGGLGDDTYVYKSAAEFAAGEKIIDAGGLDTVDFISTTPGEILTLSNVTGVENYVLDPAGAVNFGIDVSAVTAAANISGNDFGNDITGTAKADTIAGGKGDDTIRGGAGNDSIVGGEGTDSISGGAGADTISMALESPDAINAGALSENNLLVLTGNGFATVDFRVAPGADQLTMIGDVNTQTGFASVDASAVAATGGVTFYPGLGNDTFEGGAGNDTWVVHSQAELGNDVYTDHGGSLGDYLYFDNAVNGTTFTVKDSNVDGVDVIALGNPSHTGPSWTANTNIDVSTDLKPLSLAGNAGNNKLTGTANSETFFDLGGKDTVNGGGGDDSYVIIGNWVPGEKIFDSSGNDTFYLATGQTLTINPADIVGIESFVVSGANLNDQGIGSYQRDITQPIPGGFDAHLLGYGVNLSGSYGDNSLIGTAFADTIVGWKGHDTIEGGGGADTITMDVGTANLDDIKAGAITEGNLLLLVDAPTGVVNIDLMNAIDQVVSINGAPESFVQSGFLNVDASGMTRPNLALPTDHFGVVLAGTAAANRLTGSNDNDVLIGRGGADQLSAGGGDDAIVFASQAEYTAALSIDGGSGNDTLIFSSLTAGQTFAPTPDKALGIEKIAIADAAGAITDTTALNINASAFTGTGMDLAGNNGANLITGTAKDDTLTGNGGADTLNGGAGNDLYLFKVGTDVVAGERITDSAGIDTIRFADDTSGGALALTAAMTGIEKVEISNGPDTLVGALLLDVDASLLPKGILFTGNKFNNQMTGTAFNDTIDAGLGNDTILAGGGADVITMSVVAADMDNVDGGAIAEGNRLVLTGDPGGPMVWDLSSGTNQLVNVNAVPAVNIILNITSLDASGLVGTNGVTVAGSAEANKLTGTANDDLFITATPFVTGDSIAAGLGNDILRFTSVTGGQSLVMTGLFTGIEVVQISDATGYTGGTTALNLSAVLVGNALVIDGNDGNNSIVGTNFADTIVGGLGADTINAGGGADIVTVDVAALDIVNGGALAEGNTLALTGPAAADLVFNLSLAAGSQLAGGSMSGFAHLDASAMTGFGVNVTGSAAGNKIIGSPQADTIVGGLGADTIGVDVGGLPDTVNAGAETEGNLLLLSGTAGGTVTVDLSVLGGDQLTSMAGTQGGFQHVDASSLTGAGISVMGSAAANSIAGSAQADSIAGGLGADTISFDVGGGADTLDGGAGGEGDLLVLTGIAAGAVTIDLTAPVGGDQVTNVAGVQSDFQHVDASAMTGGGINVTGNGLDNNVTGTMFGDTLYGGAGADTFDLAVDTMADQVVYQRPSDGANGLAAAFSFDRIKHFTPGQDQIAFTSDFKNGAFALNDISPLNNTFDFAVDQKADFAHTHEALLITSDKSGIKTELGLTGSNFAAAAVAINKFGVIAGMGDDGLILIQSHGGTAAAPIDRTGIYYYQESDGIANHVSAGELTLLGVVEAKITGSDVSFI